MCAIDDCEPWAVVDTRERKARKAHRCTECGRTIRPGETYTHTRGKMEDDPSWSEYRTCRHCLAAGMWLQIMCGGWPLTGLLDELDEHAQEYSSSEVLPELLMSVKDGWNDGQAPIPTEADLRADARRCLGELVSP